MRSLLIFGLVMLGIIVSHMPVSESVLWDLIIIANFGKNPILLNENPTINGQVVDHAGKPVPLSTITIRIGSHTVFTETDESGLFKYEFEDFQKTPGRYIAYISASTDDGRTGFANIDLQVKGDYVVTKTATLMNTTEAQYYINSDPEKFKNDPVGMKLYEYYQHQYALFQIEEAHLKKLSENQRYLEEQRDVARDLEDKIIREQKPGAGTYDGWKRDVFVDNLDSSVKDIIENQLNYTTNVFKEAQEAMDEVLRNGGTAEEARKAYFEKASISREIMQSMTRLPTAELITNQTAPNDTFIEIAENNTNTEPVAPLLVNGTAFSLTNGSTIVSIKVNGTTIQFLMNGTQIIPLNETNLN